MCLCDPRSFVLSRIIILDSSFNPHHCVRFLFVNTSSIALYVRFDGVGFASHSNIEHLGSRAPFFNSEYLLLFFSSRVNSRKPQMT